MTTITAHATRSDGWWAVSFDTSNGVFHTQAKRLDLVPDMVLDILAMEGIEAEVEVVPDAASLEAVADARAAAKAAAAAVDAAAVKSRAAVARLRADGYSVRDIGTLMGISAQRVSQLAS